MSSEWIQGSHKFQSVEETGGGFKAIWKQEDMKISSWIFYEDEWNERFGAKEMGLKT